MCIILAFSVYFYTANRLQKAGRMTIERTVSYPIVKGLAVLVADIAVGGLSIQLLMDGVRRISCLDGGSTVELFKELVPGRNSRY